MFVSELKDLLASAPQNVVLDTEHLPNVQPSLKHLLGISLSWDGCDGLYIPINHWQGAPSKDLKSELSTEDYDYLASWLRTRIFSGWNIEHDREWLDACFGFRSNWEDDGRILWYLIDRDQKERGYGLKSAQLTLLGWAEANDMQLSEEVMAAGGSLKKGDHYLASVSTLARYAELDAYSTRLCIEVCKKLGDEDPNLKANHDANRDYAAFLAKVTQQGVEVNESDLLSARQFYERELDIAASTIREVCSSEIKQLEEVWLQKWLRGVGTDRGREARASDLSRHPKFNFNSPKQVGELLYDVIGIPVTELTKTGARSTKKDVIATIDHPAAKSLLAYSQAEQLYTMANSYLQHARNGRVHFPHNTVATVSERLGGYAPYDLNMPFNSRPIMSAFRLPTGRVGIHMDFVSIEPCLIAGFSGDETMLKVYRDGLGDVYLDLDLDLFPLREANRYDVKTQETIEKFHSVYDPKKPTNSTHKELFKKLRDVAKIIHLAVSYTGTKYTVSKNLTRMGFPTNLDKADLLVHRYWGKFSKVARLAASLKRVAEERGYIHGLYNRRLYIPKKQTKDALNRFGQHGGHAILRATVMDIAKEADGLDMRALLPDVHDSTSWDIPEVNLEKGKQLFEDAIRRVNFELALPIQVRGEIKTFHSLYGLKGKD